MFENIIVDESDSLKVDFLLPVRIVAKEKCAQPEVLLRHRGGQAVVAGVENCCDIQPGGWVLLDFGHEIHGGIELVSGTFPGVQYDSDADKGIRLHVTFGESVSEALAAPDYCHAVQNTDLMVVPWSTVPCGELGFRFVRVANVDTKPYYAQGLRARFVHRDLARTASFESSDPVLNRIWETAADTLELCMQRYLVDGIKRDRLVWMGDMYPEIVTCGLVFGKRKVVEDSLDFLRDKTPLPRFMNGLFGYSLWWILAHRCWFRYFGDLDYLRRQRDYLAGLVRVFTEMTGSNGEPAPAKFGILDWATDNERGDAVPGLKALFVLAMRAAAELLRLTDDPENAATAEKLADGVRAQPIVPSAGGNALQVLAGLRPAGEVYDSFFARTLPKGLSPFLGCMTLDACVMAGHKKEALDHLRRYWGGMLALGATSFWEHFDVDWLENAARIDEPVPAGKRDVHRECGSLCFKGLRNSFCHGWASQPAEWLIRNLLGITFVSADAVAFSPDLCGLDFVRGTLQTPRGTISAEIEAGKKPRLEFPRGIGLCRAD